MGVGALAAYWQVARRSFRRYSTYRGATFAGVFTIDLAADTLTYSVAPVPLPAGVWLLLSGLAGLGVFGRRRAVAPQA